MTAVLSPVFGVPFACAALRAAELLPEEAAVLAGWLSLTAGSLLLEAVTVSVPRDSETW